MEASKEEILSEARELLGNLSISPAEILAGDFDKLSELEPKAEAKSEMEASAVPAEANEIETDQYQAEGLHFQEGSLAGNQA